MSYEVELVDPSSGECLQHKEVHNACGGTYAVGGTSKLWLNVTYNYARILRGVLTIPESAVCGMHVLEGMSAADSLPLLDKAISELKEEEPSYYWDATEGNVRQALSHLRQFALWRPDGVWRIT